MSEKPLPTVSVVIPVYNQAERLRETVPAVLALDGVTEVIWVDDGSTDDSYSVIAKYLQSTPSPQRARIEHHSTNRGRAAARNIGWRQARGEVVFFLDADIRPYPDAACAHARAHTEPGVVATLSCDSPEGLDPNDAFHAYLLTKSGPSRYAPDEPLPLRYLIIGYTAIRADALRAVGGFDERIAYGEDLELAWRLRQQWPDAFRFVAEARVRQGDMGKLTDRLSKLEQFGQELPALFARHHGLAEEAGLSSVASAPRRMLLAAMSVPARILTSIVPAPLRPRLIRMQLAAAVASGYAGAASSSSSAP